MEDIFATGFTEGEMKTLFDREEEPLADAFDEPEPDEGGAEEEPEDEFSVYLSFPNRQAAEKWLEDEGVGRSFPKGGRNIVIHMEGTSYEDTGN